MTLELDVWFFLVLIFCSRNLESSINNVLNDPPTGLSFWQKDSLITHIFLDYAYQGLS